MSSKIMHGARAQVILNGKTVGIFTNVSWGSIYDVQPAYILGAFGPAALEYTAAEPIGISASGWRVVNHGPYTEAGGSMPKLQDLLTAEDLSFAIYDRQTGVLLAKVVGVKHSGFNTSVANRQLEEMSLNFVGLRISDESAENNESGTASQLP
jgi:hypothetical protein